MLIRELLAALVMMVPPLKFARTRLPLLPVPAPLMMPPAFVLKVALPERLRIPTLLRELVFPSIRLIVLTEPGARRSRMPVPRTLTTE